MRTFRRFRCEHGHELLVRGPEPHAQPPRCAEGHEAVTCNEEGPTEEVQILLRPAARVVDSITGRSILEGRYYLVLLTPEGLELRHSEEHYEWEDALRRASLFRGKEIGHAARWWDKANA